MESLAYRHITDRDKREICTWHYAGEYGIYNLPPYEDMQERKMGFLNPEKEKNFYVFWNGETLVGYVNLREEENEVFIGIGVAPNLCGKGYGFGILQETYWISRKLYPDKPLYLEVRSWNNRAIRCYEKAGFVMDGDSFVKETPGGAARFNRMIRK